jgi:hypothetical protein
VSFLATIAVNPVVVTITPKAPSFKRILPIGNVAITATPVVPVIGLTTYIKRVFLRPSILFIPTPTGSHPVGQPSIVTSVDAISIKYSEHFNESLGSK